MVDIFLLPTLRNIVQENILYDNGDSSQGASRQHLYCSPAMVCLRFAALPRLLLPRSLQRCWLPRYLHYCCGPGDSHQLDDIRYVCGHVLDVHGQLI